MKKPIRFSLLAFMVVVTLASVYMGLAKLFGIQSVTLGVVGISATIMLGFAIRIFFFDR